MLGRYYFGENRKLFRIKPMLILLAFLLIFGVLSAILYHVSYDLLPKISGGNIDGIIDGWELGDSFGWKDEDGNPITEEDYAAQNGYVNTNFIRLANPTNIDTIIAEIRAYYEVEKINEKAIKNYSSKAYYFKSSLTMLEYMKENAVYGEDVRVNGYGMEATSGENFMSFTMGLLFSILVLYGIVVASGFMADEYRKGTIKMMMIRPVHKVTVPAAKLLSLFTHIASIAGVAALLSFAYGCIDYGSVSTQTSYIVFNASSVLRSTVGAVVLNQLFFGLLEVLCAVTLSFALGAVLRRRTVALVIGLVVNMGFFQILFDIFNGSGYLFSSVIDLTRFFSINYTVGAGSNFFLSLGLLVAYLAIILTTMFVTVRKRDIV